MTRTNAIPILVVTMLVAAAPAAGGEGYRSPDSIVAAGGAQAAPVSDDARSAKQLFAGSAGARPSPQAGGQLPTPDTYIAQRGKGLDPSQATVRLPTPDTYLAQQGQDRPISVEPTVASSPPASSVDGFHWGDAGLGAGIALVLLALGRAGLVVRRRMVHSSAAPTS